MNKRPLFLVLSLIALVFVSATSAQATADSYALLVQQSPVDAGSVTPGSGVHNIQIGQTVSLSAIPKPGYRFLYWLGDVSAAGTTDTTIEIDSPKMVVAVFTRQAYEEELPGVSLIKGTNSGGSSGGRLIGTPISSPGSVNPGSYYDPSDFVYVDNTTTIINEPDETYNDDVPVPDDDNDANDDIPVPDEDGTEVPEPATVLLLGLGSVAFFKRNRNEKK